MATVSSRGINPTAVTSVLNGTDLQGVINTMQAAGQGGIIQLPRVLDLTSPITITNATGIRLVGNSTGGSKVRWLGSGSAFRFIGTARCSLEQTDIEVLYPCSAAIYINDLGAGGGNIRTSGFHGAHLFIQCNGIAERAIWIQRTPDGGKNDHHYFDRVWAQSYTQAFCQLEGQAAVNTEFHNCIAQSREYGNYGVYCVSDTGVGRGGQFNWFGGTLMEHKIADIRGDWRNGKNQIIGATCEQSARLLMVDSPGGAFSGNSWVIQGLEWVNNATVHPDDDEIIQVYGGSLTLIGGTYGQSANTNDYKIRYDVPAAKRLGFNVLGVTWWTPLAANWFSALTPDSSAGSYVRSGSSTLPMV